MSEKKNIDRLFQEKFKDFEAAPPEFVWDNIQEALQEKKKKRVVPIWIRLSGVAALLLIGLFLGWQYFNSINPDTNPVVIENPAAQPKQPLKIAPSQIPIPNGGTVSDSTNGAANPINSAVVSNDANAGTSNNSPEKNNSNKLNGNNTNTTGTAAGTSASAKKASSALSTKNNAVAHGGGNQNRNGNGTNKRNIAKGNRQLNLTNPATGVAATSVTKNNSNSSAGSITSGNRNTANRNSGNGSRFTNPANNSNTGIAQGGNPSNTNITNKQGGVVNGGTTNNTSAVADGAKPGQSKINGGEVGRNNPSVTNGAGVGNNTTTSATGIANNTGNTANPANNSGDDKNTTNQGATTIDKTLPVNEQAIAETKVDTTTAKPENELEKLLREKLNGEKENKDDDQVADAENSKWKLKPQIAPLFYNSLSKGSPIDGQFAGNSKSYDKDLSYGLGINYEVSSRLSIRSGVNAINLSYATQGVEFYASLSGQTSNIAARTSSATIVVQNQGAAPSSASPVAAMFADVLPKETFNGSMVQTTGYVEVPVELSYALLNKKFGIDIIGGVSTLFLNDNNVSVVSNQGFATSIGEAENLNNIHFSTNVGIGFKYKFFKAFEANFEPMFKYQLNTYSRDSGNFKPYFIGLYSGISFSF